MAQAHPIEDEVDLDEMDWVDGRIMNEKELHCCLNPPNAH